MLMWLNETARLWGNYFGLMIIQSTIFLGGVLLLLYLFRKHNARFLRFIALLGLLKLFLPPVLFHGSGISLTLAPAMPIGPEAAVGIPAGAHTTLSPVTLVMLGWALIALALLVYTALRFIPVIRRLRNAIPIASPALVQSPKRFSLYKSSEVISPMVMSIMRPRILVPSSWDTLSSDTQTGIIRHELAHIHQQDHLIGIAQILALAVNFFNPLAWILVKKLNAYSELTCDESAISGDHLDARTYLHSLIDVAETSSRQNTRIPLAIPAFSEEYHNLHSRIRYQLGRQAGKIPGFSRKHLLVLLIAGLLMVPFSCDYFQQGHTTPTALESPAIQSESKPPTIPDTSIAIAKLVPYDQPPQLIGGMQALQSLVKYPSPAKEVGIEGTVIVQAFINKQGEVAQTKVVKGVPKSGLDEAAVQAVSQTRWEPARQDNRTVGVWYSIPIVFRLKPKSTQ